MNTGTTMSLSFSKNGTMMGATIKGIQQTKAVDISEVLAIMNANAVHDFGLFPQNTRHLSIAGANYTIAVEIPERKINLLVQTSDVHKPKLVEKVPLPAGLAIFCFVAKDNGFFHTESYLFALAGDRLTFPTDKLYAYPLPNIYKDEHKICWGHVDMKLKLKSLYGVEGLLSGYFSSQFNHDLFDTSKLHQTKFPWNKLVFAGGNYDIHSYFRYLADNGLNKDWLQPLTGDFEDVSKAFKKLGR